MIQMSSGLTRKTKSRTRKWKAKNRSTYVDILNGKVLLPQEQVSQEDAKEMIEMAFNCLSAHWQSESLTNPVVSTANKAN